MAWIIDPAHSQVGFSVKHMMVTTVHGRFRSYRGQIDFNPEAPLETKASIEIDVASVDTSNADRDGHLRTGDFFHAEEHPTITFKTTKIEPESDGFKVHGDLTMRGITKPIVLDAELSGVAKNGYGKTILGLSASGTIKRQDFGVSFHQLLETGGLAVADKVKLEIDVQAYREEE